MYVGLFAVTWYIRQRLYVQGVDELNEHWFFWLSPWLRIVQDLAPGVLCGLLATRRSLLSGALASLFGGFVSAALFQIWWAPPIPIYLVGLVLLSGLQAAPFGVAGAAVGFLLRSAPGTNAPDASGDPSTRSS